MKPSFIKLGFTGLLLLSLLAWWLAFSYPITSKTIRFKITENSTLAIEGSSTVNSFYCGYEEQFQQYCSNLNEQEHSSIIYFDNTTLEVQANSFDCGGKIINRDMQSALKAKQHPKISISLQEVDLGEPGLFEKACEDWIRIKAKTVITLAGNSQTVYLDINGKEIQSKEFRFTGSKDLLMSDFGIDPPRPMMGLIKVKDEITIYLDLVVQVVDEA